MKPIKLIKTKHDKGCAVACIATVLETSYDEVEKNFENDFERDGLAFGDTMNYLGDNGFSLIHKEIRNYASVKFGRQELFKPFAPIHIIRLQSRFDSEYGHVVIMDEKGGLHCPSGYTKEDIENAYIISNVVGCYKN